MKKTVVLIGKESVGKSQLLRSLTGRQALSERLKGTTVHVHSYNFEGYRFVDTPGIFLDGDSLTTKLALAELSHADCVVLVASALSLAEDLNELLPLVQNKQACLVITHWDKLAHTVDTAILRELQAELGIAVFAFNARNIAPSEKHALLENLTKPKKLQNSTAHNERPSESLASTHSNTIHTIAQAAQQSHGNAPKSSAFDIPVLGRSLALLLLFVPAVLAVASANFLADSLNEGVIAAIQPMLTRANALPAPLSHVLGMDYGIIAMFPFLLLYALPTVFLFAFVLSLYKTSGLVDRLSISLHSLVAPFGLAGRDIVRVIMGFGCNVPAVLSSRSCSSCTRGNCVSAISFGAACSYQFPATVAVFAAAGMTYLVLPYLLVLCASTLVYLYFTTSKEAKEAARRLAMNRRDSLQLPSLRGIVAETKVQVREFLTLALPVFLVICVVAGLLDWLGVIPALSRLLSPVMALFNLPADAATSIVLGSIRKDGIAIGLLNPAWDGLKVSVSSPAQVLSIVYIAGVLLPCMVTLITIVHEMGLKFALRMLRKQVLAALAFSLTIAWTGHALHILFS